MARGALSAAGTAGKGDGGRAENGMGSAMRALLPIACIADHTAETAFMAAKPRRTGPTSSASSPCSAAGVVAVPLFKRLGLGSVLGYLAAGLVIGPFGLGLFSDTADHPARRRARRRALPLRDRPRDAAVAALGDARRDLRARGGAGRRSACCCSGPSGSALGYPLAPSLIAGTGFVLTSTAIVMQMLEERGAHHPAQGRRIIAILLLEDLAIVPLLALVAFLAPGGETATLGAPAGRGRRSASRRSRRWWRRGAGCSTPSSASSPWRGRAR